MAWSDEAREAAKAARAAKAKHPAKGAKVAKAIKNVQKTNAIMNGAWKMSRTPDSMRAVGTRLVPRTFGRK